jgi:hypothetical protein
VLTRDKKMHLSAILAEQSPTNEAIAGQSGRFVDSLNLSDGAFVVGDEIAPIRCDGEGATCVKGDVDDIVIRCPGQQGSHEVGIEVCAGYVRVECQREMSVVRSETEGKAKIGGWRWNRWRRQRIGVRSYPTSERDERPTSC